MYIITRSILKGSWTPEFYHVAPIKELWYYAGDFKWTLDREKAKRFDSEDAAEYDIEYPLPLGVIQIVQA